MTLETVFFLNINFRFSQKIFFFMSFNSKYLHVLYMYNGSINRVHNGFDDVFVLKMLLTFPTISVGRNACHNFLLLL